jgi:hypothetical protein
VSITEDELESLNAAERRAQGLPDFITDPATIATVATLAASALRARAAEAVMANGKGS